MILLENGMGFTAWISLIMCSIGLVVIYLSSKKKK